MPPLRAAHSRPCLHSPWWPPARLPYRSFGFTSSIEKRKSEDYVGMQRQMYSLCLTEVLKIAYVYTLYSVIISDHLMCIDVERSEIISQCIPSFTGYSLFFNWIDGICWKLSCCLLVYGCAFIGCNQHGSFYRCTEQPWQRWNRNFNSWITGQPQVLHLSLRLNPHTWSLRLTAVSAWRLNQSIHEQTTLLLLPAVGQQIGTWPCWSLKGIVMVKIWPWILPAEVFVPWILDCASVLCIWNNKFAAIQSWLCDKPTHNKFASLLASDLLQFPCFFFLSWSFWGANSILPVMVLLELKNYIDILDQHLDIFREK